ncbi:hypothetical protein [Microbulbifer taiwanensis]|uniref:hypothetical protein n=1 Tax=Microbulbifer taiwanensis TaxID=986746 RepID=UPI00361FB43E
MSLIPRGSLLDLDNMFEQMLSPARTGGKEGFSLRESTSAKTRTATRSAPNCRV